MGNLDNLGDYGKFTTAAKKFGGVPALLRAVEKGAVAKAAPKLRAQGAAAGALVTGAGLTGLRYVQRVRTKREEEMAAAAAAKAKLQALVEAAEEDGGLDDEDPRVSE